VVPIYRGSTAAGGKQEKNGKQKMGGVPLRRVPQKQWTALTLHRTLRPENMYSVEKRCPLNQKKRKKSYKNTRTLLKDRIKTKKVMTKKLGGQKKKKSARETGPKNTKKKHTKQQQKKKTMASFSKLAKKKKNTRGGVLEASSFLQDPERRARKEKKNKKLKEDY